MKTTFIDVFLPRMGKSTFCEGKNREFRDLAKKVIIRSLLLNALTHT